MAREGGRLAFLSTAEAEYIINHTLVKNDTYIYTTYNKKVRGINFYIILHDTYMYEYIALSSHAKTRFLFFIFYLFNTR